MQETVRFLRSVPKRNYLYLGLGFAVAAYGLMFFIPKQVAFSYAGPTCHDRLTLFPQLQTSRDASYVVSFDAPVKVGSVIVASQKTCFKVKSAPVEGATIVGTAPFDGPIARTLYKVRAKKAPSLAVSSIKKQVPSTKPLLIPMSEGDVIHDYILAAEQKSATCNSSNGQLTCDVPSMKLEQGKRYEFAVQRSFKGEDEQKIATGSFETLKAVVVTDGTVKPDQLLYSRPKELIFTADKAIAAASVTLQVDGKPIEVTQAIEGSTLKLALSAELPREKSIALTITSLEATDGSTLVEPYSVGFKTSGGPKITGVSAEATGVGQSAAITLTFDQPLSKTKDIVPFVTFVGGQATVQKRSDTQVVVQLNGLPLCQAFTITAKAGIPSEHDLASSAPWNFNGRTTCYQTISYGTSLKGRALTSYIFGSTGPVTMYVGGIHGSEPSSTNLMRAWMTELEANPTRYAGKRIVIVPAINPDGLATGSRTNSRGVNLNRNFPTDNWAKSIKDTDGTHATGGGETPLSEPEAAALAKLTTSYRPRLLLSFHAVGSLAIGDPGGVSAGYAAKYASMVGYRDGTNQTSTNFDYNVTGGYEDWTYRNQGIPSIVVELSSYSSVTYSGHYKALWAMLD